MVPPFRWIRPQSMPGRSLEHSRTPSVSRSPSCTVYENSRVRVALPTGPEYSARRTAPPTSSQTCGRPGSTTVTSVRIVNPTVMVSPVP